MSLLLPIPEYRVYTLTPSFPSPSTEYIPLFPPSPPRVYALTPSFPSLSICPNSLLPLPEYIPLLPPSPLKFTHLTCFPFRQVAEVTRIMVAVLVHIPGQLNKSRLNDNDISLRSNASSPKNGMTSTEVWIKYMPLKPCSSYKSSSETNCSPVKEEAVLRSDGWNFFASSPLSVLPLRSCTMTKVGSSPTVSSLRNLLLGALASTWQSRGEVFPLWELASYLKPSEVMTAGDSDPVSSSLKDNVKNTLNSKIVHCPYLVHI